MKIYYLEKCGEMYYQEHLSFKKRYLHQDTVKNIDFVSIKKDEDIKVMWKTGNSN